MVRVADLEGEDDKKSVEERFFTLKSGEEIEGKIESEGETIRFNLPMGSQKLL